MLKPDLYELEFNEPQDINSYNKIFEQILVVWLNIKKT